MSPTFAESFCAKNNIDRAHFARAVLDRILYPRTRLVKWLLPLLHREHFAADFDLIYGVENLRRMRDFTTEAERFNEHPANHGWLRRTLCLRASTGRLRALIRETLPARPSQTSPESPQADEGTTTPFASAGGRR